jgi:ribosome-binding factor A
MASIRQEKVSSLLKRELALIFQRESRNLFEGRFITVTQVRVAPDLGSAKVYLSFMAVADKQVALEQVKSVDWKVRQILGSVVGKQLRRTPELFFYLDDSLDYYDEIDRLLKS